MSTDSILFFIAVFCTYILCWFSRIKYRLWIISALSILFIIFINPKTSIIFFALAVCNFNFVKRFKSTFFSTALVIINIAFLITLKYLPTHSIYFFESNHLVPIGFSIFIFQQISFIVDAKHLDVKNLTFFEYIFYSIFFGNITTGPINQFSFFQDQKERILLFTKSGIDLGVIYICTGLFKKLVVADNVSQLTVFLFDGKLYESNLIIPFVFSKYEIYANFSGYSDIAIGLCSLFGFTVPKNFNRPFATTSIIEFWKRWHMSLTAWIRQYVFYPLTISKLNRFGPYPIMAITFIIFALWHDITWIYITYGLIQVILIFLSYKLGFIKSLIDNAGIFKPVVTLIKWLWFYLILISVPGILFRSESFTQFFKILQNLVSTPLSTANYFVMHAMSSIYTCIMVIILMEILDRYFPQEKILKVLSHKKIFFKSFVFLLLIVTIALLRQNIASSNFIYSNY